MRANQTGMREIIVVSQNVIQSMLFLNGILDTVHAYVFIGSIIFIIIIIICIS